MALATEDICDIFSSSDSDVAGEKERRSVQELTL
jgi:hypothetical protein